MREDVEINTHDQVTLRGWFFPAGTKAPVVVMSPGFSGIKENFLDIFAARFQEAGFAALLYDHRNWGASDGLPRHHTNHYEQTQDAHDVVHYASTRPDVDFDLRIKVVVAQVPLVSGRATREALPKGLLTKIFADRGQTSILEPTYTPIFPASLEEAQNLGNGALLGTEECWHHLQAVKALGREKENKVTVQSLFHAISAEPSAFITQVSPKPLFMAVSLGDTVIDPRVQLDAYATAGEPKELLELECGHFNVYRGEFFEVNISAQIAFLKKYL